MPAFPCVSARYYYTEVARIYRDKWLNVCILTQGCQKIVDLHMTASDSWLCSVFLVQNILNFNQSLH